MRKKRIAISLSDEVLDLLEEKAKTLGISKSAYITTLIDKELNLKERATK